MMQEYIHLNRKEVENLNKEKTIFFMAVSPIEVHGDHLPLGTDVVIAEELQKRYEVRMQKKYPEYKLVRLPSLYLGSDAVPVKGSLPIPATTLKEVLISMGKGLAEQGFHYLFLSDNHGGPRHQMAMELAARKLWKDYRFYLVNPFNLVYRLMVQNNEDFLEKTGLEPGKCGDAPDTHAGTNETSLMMAAAPAMIDDTYKSAAPSPLPPPDRTVLTAAKLTGIVSDSLKKELSHLAALMGWVKDPAMKSYMGMPDDATEEAGEAMLEARVEIAMVLFGKALRGDEIKIPPMLWKLRILHRFPA